MKRASFRFALPWLLALLGSTAPAQCVISCGDCNGDGQQSILDALLAGQIAVAAVVATPAQQVACDVEPVPADGDVDALDSLRLAQVGVGLPVNLGCFPVVIAPEGYGVPIPVVHASATASDPDRIHPQLACPDTTVFFEVQPSGATDRLVLVVSGMSIPTDLDLYVGAPGVPPGDITAANYPRRSRRVDAQDETIELACGGLTQYGGSIAVAVHAVVGGMFTFQVLGDPLATCTCGATTVAAGTRFAGMLAPVAGPCPPSPCAATSVQLEIPSLPAGTTRLTLQMIGPGPASDYDLFLGNPGVCAGDCFGSNFQFWASPFFLERIFLSGTALSAYGGGPIAVGVAVFDGPGNGQFTLDVLPAGAGGPPVPSAAGTSPVAGSVAVCRTVTHPQGHADAWQFAAAAGDTIEVVVDTASAGGAFDPLVELREVGAPTLVGSADGPLPCTFAPPAASGADCPRLQLAAPTTGSYEVQVMRSPNGFCTDADNGAYVLTVLVNGVSAVLSPSCDDC